jgi:hypothetical protein
MTKASLDPTACSAAGNHSVQARSLGGPGDDQRYWSGSPLPDNLQSGTAQVCGRPGPYPTFRHALSDPDQRVVALHAYFTATVCDTRAFEHVAAVLTGQGYWAWPSDCGRPSACGPLAPPVLASIATSIARRGSHAISGRTPVPSQLREFAPSGDTTSRDGRFPTGLACHGGFGGCLPVAVLPWATVTIRSRWAGDGTTVGLGRCHARNCR